MYEWFVSVSECADGEYVRIEIGSQPNVNIPDDYVVINPAEEGPLAEDLPVTVNGYVL